MDHDWGALPAELRERANEVYLATGFDAGILHDVAYQLEADHRRIAELERALREIGRALPCVDSGMANLASIARHALQNSRTKK